MNNDDSGAVRHSSIAGSAATGVTSPKSSRKTNLDPSDPSTWTSRHNSTDFRPRASSATEPQIHPTEVPKISVGADILHELAKEDYEDKPKVSPPPKPRSVSSSMAAALSGDLKSLRIGSGSPTQRTMSSTSSQSNSNPVSTTLLSPDSPKAKPAMNDENGRRFSTQSATPSEATDYGETIGRIERDENDEMALQSSDEERDRSDDEESLAGSERGRQRKLSRESQQSLEENKDTSGPPSIQVDAPPTTDTTPPPHPDSVHHSGKLSETHGKITPRSNYRAASPAALSNLGDDNAELQRAKALPLRVSPLDDKITDRHVKMLIRGEWSSFQNFEDEQQEYRHEPRLYLVCSDLSNEASYALEWTVGTLLKDGDTILIISALEDEHASKHPEEQEATSEIKMESAKAAEEATETMILLTRQTTLQEGNLNYDNRSALSKVAEANRTPSRPSSRNSRVHTKQDDERIKAVDKLETDFLKFVRKTTLQVRCMIEVIHCRSSRHLILNAIDELEPTLVVVGTRGLGAVKNVVMGSFSNYLVQKSSIPVMVARKRLKKPHHAKISSQQIRMTNNLMPVKVSGKRMSLTQARID